jgi:hypothetical protein
METNKKHNRQLKDYKHHHCWESIGVISRQNGEISQVYECLQCKKCKLELRYKIW